MLFIENQYCDKKLNKQLVHVEMKNTFPQQCNVLMSIDILHCVQSLQNKTSITFSAILPLGHIIVESVQGSKCNL